MRASLILVLVGIGSSALVITSLSSCKGGGGDLDTVGESDAATTSSSSSSGASSSGSNGSSGSSADAASDVCGLPSETGNCDGAFPRFFFNAQTRRCERFSYGGCGGNENNFETIIDCVKACAPTAENPCTVTTCDDKETCLFSGTTPTCATSCITDAGASTCDPGTTCKCGASCPGCKDCRQACLP